MSAVLVVDDDEDIRTALADALADEGYAVCQAVDGEDALETMSTMPTLPNLVLLDIMMPRMNGNEFLDAIARVPRFASVPVVVVSAYDGLVRGVVKRIVPKPVSLHALLAIVEEFCGAHA